VRYTTKGAHTDDTDIQYNARMAPTIPACRTADDGMATVLDALDPVDSNFLLSARAWWFAPPVTEHCS
jgi:hypothetical protein